MQGSVSRWVLLPGSLLVTRSPVSSVQVSPSSVDFQTTVPYARRAMALRSEPCSTRVLPVHERLPERVAPWSKSDL